MKTISFNKLKKECEQGEYRYHEWIVSNIEITKLMRQCAKCGKIEYEQSKRTDSK